MNRYVRWVIAVPLAIVFFLVLDFSKGFEDTGGFLISPQDWVETGAFLIGAAYGAVLAS